LIFRRNGLLEEALSAFRRSEAINPRPIASASRASASDKVREVSEEAGRAQTIEHEGSAVLAGLAPGTAAYHLRLAEFLEHKGEGLLARGQRLRAAVAGAGR
jgi:hypothetical protein